MAHASDCDVRSATSQSIMQGHTSDSSCSWSAEISSQATCHSKLHRSNLTFFPLTFPRGNMTFFRISSRCHVENDVILWISCLKIFPNIHSLEENLQFIVFWHYCFHKVGVGCLGRGKEGVQERGRNWNVTFRATTTVPARPLQWHGCGLSNVKLIVSFI